MNVRQQIIRRVEQDIVNLKTDFGYDLNYPNIFKGNYQIDLVKSFPTVCYDLGNEPAEFVGAAYNQVLKDMTLTFWIYINAFGEKGRIVDVREQVISDFNKFIMQDDSISGYGTEDWKVLRLDLLNPRINTWTVQMAHTTVSAEQKAIVEITVNITYYDFYQDQTIPENI